MRMFKAEAEYGTWVHETPRLPAGEASGLPDVISTMQQLVNFYPKHIEKEDRHFFPDTERHFSKQELDAMIEEFYTFDMRMIHEKYAAVIDSFE